MHKSKMNYCHLLKMGLSFQQPYKHHFKEKEFCEDGFGVSLSKRGDFGIPIRGLRPQCRVLRRLGFVVWSSSSGLASGSGTCGLPTGCSPTLRYARIG